jgi:tetratricopeptide (TPR) repeat protein
LNGGEKKRLAKRYTDSGEAYQLYMLGRYYSRTRSEKFLQKSIEIFEQAIKKDPNYAPAYAGLAQAYGSLGYNGMLPPKEAREKEELAALKAIAIDDELAEAHVAMADLREQDLNWAALEEECKRALELNPNSVEVQTIYANHLNVLGRFDEGMLHLKRAQELDPLSLMTGADIGFALYLSRQHDRAIEQFQKTLEIDPNFVAARARLGWAYLAKGMYEQAIAELEKAKTLDERSKRSAVLGYAYAMAGKRDEAHKILGEFKELSKQPQRYVSPYDLALIYMGLGDKDQAFVWLEKTYEERADILQHMKVSPRYDNLRSDPRFTELLRRMKLAT